MILMPRHMLSIPCASTTHRNTQSAAVAVCGALLPCAVLCSAVPCSAVLCHAILYCATLVIESSYTDLRACGTLSTSPASPAHQKIQPAVERHAAVPCRAVPSCSMFRTYYLVLNCILLCHAVPCSSASCRAISCCAILCRAVLVVRSHPGSEIHACRTLSWGFDFELGPEYLRQSTCGRS